MNEYPYCNSKTFKTDISQLCERCPLIKLTKGYIKNQILFQALEKQEILTNEEFDKYLKDEIDNAQKAMDRTYLNELKLNDPIYRKKRIEIYIINKERIKALRKLSIKNSMDESVDNKKNLHNHIFCNNGFELFSYLLENYIAKDRGRYADLSYYYWRMYKDTPQLIHQRPEPFKSWFCQTYQENFEKIKTLNEVTGQKGYRDKNYSISLDWFNNQS